MVVNVFPLMVRVSVCVVKERIFEGSLRVAVLVIVPDKVLPDGILTENDLGIPAIIPNLGSEPSVIVEIVPSPEVTFVVPSGRISLTEEQLVQPESTTLLLSPPEGISAIEYVFEVPSEVVTVTLHPP